jgi:DNA-binding GntR family transcriptional regulator
VKRNTATKRAAAARALPNARQRVSLLEQAYDEIKHRIITCRYRPGEVLSEADISANLKIGRTPIHQAIHKLTKDELISILPRKGVMVRPVSIDEAIEIIGIRLLTEGYCARLAAERADESELRQLEQILHSCEEAIEKRDVEKLMLLDREFHDTLARAAKNKALADTLKNFHERSLRFWFISLRDRDHHRPVLTQHRAILDALRRRDPDAAENAMREHIRAFQKNITHQV